MEYLKSIKDDVFPWKSSREYSLKRRGCCCCSLKRKHYLLKEDNSENGARVNRAPRYIANKAGNRNKEEYFCLGIVVNSRKALFNL